jgi:hypothetical protein
VPRQTAYDLRREDQAFAAAWDDALRLGVEALHDEAVRRARKGVRRPIYQGKELVGYVREYSDRLLMFLLNAHDPEKYADRHKTTIKGDPEHPFHYQHAGKLTHQLGADVIAAFQADLDACGGPDVPRDREDEPLAAVHPASEATPVPCPRHHP